MDMKKSSYLFGTIHMVCPEDYLWTPVMKKSLKECREVCFEMDMDDPSVMMEVAMGMTDNSGKKLKDYFSDSDFHYVEKFVADSLGMDIGMFMQMKPAALQSLFATKAVSCTTPVSYEVRIMEEAKKHKMTVSGLELANEQLELLNSLSAETVVKDLLAMSKDYSGETAEYSNMLQAYKAQDVAMLYRIILEHSSEGDNLDAFLDQRNRKWVSRMEDKMEQQPVFFAVGAGHLAGENGLISLLRNAGYTVTAVR